MLVVINNKDVRENSQRYAGLLRDDGFEVKVEEDNRFIFAKGDCNPRMQSR